MISLGCFLNAAAVAVEASAHSPFFQSTFIVLMIGALTTIVLLGVARGVDHIAEWMGADIELFGVSPSDLLSFLVMGLLIIEYASVLLIKARVLWSVITGK